MIMNVAYDYRLVVLSVLLATVAAYAALELAGRLTAARGWPRVLWLAGGSTAMGMGICEAGAFLVKNIRAEDFVCRFGGEEFVVILPTAAIEGARVRAERLRSKMKELTVLYQGQSVGMITVSIGVGAFPLYGNSPTELLGAADAALYRAKREGRDRVVLAELPPAAAVSGTGVGGTFPMSAERQAH
jgi:hypothetical protein